MGMPPFSNSLVVNSPFLAFLLNYRGDILEICFIFINPYQTNFETKVLRNCDEKGLNAFLQHSFSFSKRI